MADEPGSEDESVTAHLELSVAGSRIEADITMPATPVALGQMLPVFRSLADAVVGAATEAVESQGHSVSCRKGCGACCRQLVPIGEAEARRIRDLVESLPEPRRSVVRARFADARRRLAEAGLIDALEHPEHWVEDDRRSFGLDYFRQRIACPFLEEESCSIYEDRPIACREYLVTSPAEHCSRPTPETVRCVPVPTKVWPAVARFDPVRPGFKTIRWVPLILAPEWAETHADDSPLRPASEWLGELLERLTGRRIEPGGPAVPSAAPVPLDDSGRTV
jgi:Fe-S-cluster containining protein